MSKRSEVFSCNFAYTTWKLKENCWNCSLYTSNIPTTEILQLNQILKKVSTEQKPTNKNAGEKGQVS